MLAEGLCVSDSSLACLYDMIDVTRSQTSNLAPLTWTIWKGKAVMKCPNGHIGLLDDYEIDDDGVVRPSVQCPAPDCGFHDYVHLVGWV